MKLSYVALFGAVVLSLSACGSDSGPSKKDAGSDARDTAAPQPDAPADRATPQPDTPIPGSDTAKPQPDAPVVDTGPTPLDVPQPEIDGAQPGIDGAPPTVDGGQVSEAGQPRLDAGVIVLDGGIKVNGAYVELRRENFQTGIDAGATATDLFTIRNSKGLFAKITNLGAKFEQIVVPDRNGVFGDIILGYESIAAVDQGQGSMGAFISRYANRISHGKFVVDGTTYSIKVNEGAPKNNLLHGGAKGSRFRVFDATQISASQVQMTLTHLDAEDADPANGYTGFPGTLAVKVLYTVTEANEIKVEYSATTTKKTVINFTTHSFFNLGNEPTTPILDHVVMVNADKVLEINDRLVPTGVLRDVTGTPMDFRTAKPFRQDYAANYDLLNLVGGGGAGVAAGYDNHYALNKTAPGALELAASVYEPLSGRKMEVWSTEPGMQLFTGTNLTGQVPRDKGKGGVVFQKYSGFCMEPSHFPDSPNQLSFPSTVLIPGETYEGKIIYKFSVVP
ncbi:MAG: galactose mutarotase [Deltaproteobacteria bacterium]|nr:galactose mutarotase [Deltaproteobacteria bacterium]